uniref:SGNH hydrolase-type esterase domain-containing protein n=1 Tax=uncultured Acidobacteriota bacterium TaxID=171953 RepID=Q7X2V3_9BACT|nr:hypothetical protein [uncultured Acidobacteriota bacterium]
MEANSPSSANSKATHHYSRFTKLMTVLVSIFITLLVLEAGARIICARRGINIHNYQPLFTHTPGDYTRQDRARFVSHPFLPFAPRPYDSRKLFVYREGMPQLAEFDVTNNSLGFRTPERTFAKGDRVKRIVTLGGSTTWEGTRNDTTWPALLEQKLNAQYQNTGYRIEVVNLAVEMASSPMNLINLAFVGVNYQPDLVISCDGVNDSFLIGLQGVTPDYRSTLDRYDDRTRPLQARLPPWAFRSYLVSILTHKYDALTNAHVELYSQVAKNSQLPPSADPLEGIQFFERNLRSMRALSKENNAKFVASTSHWLTPFPKATLMNSELRDFFARSEIDYVDLDALLPHNDATIHTDAVHWSESGLQQLAELWKEKIVRSNLLDLNAVESPVRHHSVLRARHF